MIKTYTLNDKSEFKTITIPKGTALFRGIFFNEKDDIKNLFQDLVGRWSKKNTVEVSPTANIFFYPVPYVSQCVNNYNVNILYLTQYDLELLLMVKPAKEFRFDDDDKPNSKEIINIIETCADISEEDKCGYQMPYDDICFTDYLTHTYPMILGYIGIQKNDIYSIDTMIKDFLKKSIFNKVLQILPGVIEDERGLVGVPEVVLHPFHTRNTTCKVQFKRMDSNTHAISYILDTRGKYNYFPLLYFNSTDVISFLDLDENNNIVLDKLRRPLESDDYTLTEQPIINTLHKIMDDLLSPTGYSIRNIQYNFTIDKRTGFYLASTVYTKNRNNKTKKKLSYNLQLYSLEDGTEYVIPFTFSAEDKVRSIQFGDDVNYITEKEKILNRSGKSFEVKYVFEKGNTYLKYNISKSFQRPDLHIKPSNNRILLMKKSRKNKV